MSRSAPVSLNGLSLERANVKRAQREADERALASGQKTAADVRSENTHFVGVNVRIDWSRIKALS
jgi:hypothetical protein